MKRFRFREQTKGRPGYRAAKNIIGKHFAKERGKKQGKYEGQKFAEEYFLSLLHYKKYVPGFPAGNGRRFLYEREPVALLRNRKRANDPVELQARLQA